MKVFVVLCLASVALAGGYDREMTEQWQKLKSMESCWGEENMKIYTVEVKKAIAKCGHEDAPELSLPPYRSSYRFVNTMVNKADEYENMDNMVVMFAKMMSMMKNNRHNNYNSNNYNTDSFRPYSQDHKSSDNMETMMKMMKMKMDMMKNYNSNSNSYSNSNSNSNSDMMDMFSQMMNKMDTHSVDTYSNTNSYKKNDPMARMSNFMSKFSSRHTRAVEAKDLDLGDRLVEKLTEQKRHMEAKIGNMTCVLREMNCLDASNNIDIQAMKTDMKKFTLPSAWFGKKYEEILDTCYELATNLPANIADNSVITGQSFGSIKLGEVKMFMKCCSKHKTKLCMNQDIKKKVESNFGPMEAILEETQLTEHEFFPLVVQLLHGEEMKYMVGSM